MAVQLKRSLTSNINPAFVLEQGQVGIEMTATTNTALNPYKFKIGDGSSSWEDLPYAVDPSAFEIDTSSLVPNTRTINDYPLSEDIQLKASDVGARADDWNPSFTDISGVLSEDKGGTGVTSLEDLKSKLGVSNTTVDVQQDKTFISQTSGNKFVVHPKVEVDYFGNVTLMNAVEESYGGDYSFSTIILDHWSRVIRKDINNMVTYEHGYLYWGQPEFTSDATCALYPYTTETMANAVWTNQLGTAKYPWTTVYAKTGSIQTSDRKAKTNIHYIDSAVAPISKARAISSEPSSSESLISSEDVFSFIRQLQPVTFDYNFDGDEAPTENKQYGLIADDIETNKLFPYIGSSFTWEAQDAKYDDDGNEIQPAKEAGKSLGLKPLPLTVVALTACKYLLAEVDSLKSQLAASQN